MQNSLIQPFREGLLLLGSGWRGFYAPYNVTLGAGQPNTAVGPKMLDLTQGPFTDAGLKALGWTDIGWVKDFAITDEGKIGELRSGYRGAIRAKIRGQVGEKIAFKMREFTRMALKISSGSDIVNLLSNNLPTAVGPISASGAGNVAISMVSYDPTPIAGPLLTVAAGQGGLFTGAGTMIVADIDYDPTTYGLIGEN